MSDTNEWMPNVHQVDDDENQAMGYVRSLFFEGRTEEAQAELRTMIENDPENARPVVALGLSLLRERHLEEAAQLFERAMELDPENEVPALLAAQVGIRGDNPEYSEVNFHKALAIDPNSIRALTGLSRLHMSNDRPDEAIGVLERALEIDPQSRILRQRIAALCTEAERYDEALHHLQHVLSIFPGDEQASVQMASVYHRMGDNETALGILRTAHEGNPEHAGLMIALGHQLTRAGQYAEAEALLRQAVDAPRPPPTPPAGTPAAGAQAPGANAPGAEFMRRMAQWWQQRPRIFAQILLVQALIPQNKLLEAREMLGRMPRRGNMGAVVQRLYGDAFAFEGNVQSAEQSYRAALHAVPNGEATLQKIDAAKAGEQLSDDALLKKYTEALDKSTEEQITNLGQSQSNEE